MLYNIQIMFSNCMDVCNTGIGGTQNIGWGVETVLLIHVLKMKSILHKCNCSFKLIRIFLQTVQFTLYTVE